MEPESFCTRASMSSEYSAMFAATEWCTKSEQHVKVIYDNMVRHADPQNECMHTHTAIHLDSLTHFTYCKIHLTYTGRSAGSAWQRAILGRQGRRRPPGPWDGRHQHEGEGGGQDPVRRQQRPVRRLGGDVCAHPIPGRRQPVGLRSQLHEPERGRCAPGQLLHRGHVAEL